MEYITIYKYKNKKTFSYTIFVIVSNTVEWIKKTTHHFGLEKYFVFSTASNNTFLHLISDVRRYH